MTFAADPPGQHSGVATETDADAPSSPSSPLKSTHSPPHTASNRAMSSSASTGRHPPGSAIPHAANTRFAYDGSSRRTRTSLTGSPRPTTRLTAPSDDASAIAVALEDDAAGFRGRFATREDAPGRDGDPTTGETTGGDMPGRADV